MFSWIVGSVDWNAAAVLIAMFVALCITVSAAIAKRRSRVEINNEFALAKIKLLNEDEANKRQQQRQHEFDLGKLALEKEVEIKRIDANMLTSHARVINPDG